MEEAPNNHQKLEIGRIHFHKPEPIRRRKRKLKRVLGYEKPIINQEFKFNFTRILIQPSLL